MSTSLNLYTHTNTLPYAHTHTHTHIYKYEASWLHFRICFITNFPPKWNWNENAKKYVGMCVHVCVCVCWHHANAWPAAAHNTNELWVPLNYRCIARRPFYIYTNYCYKCFRLVVFVSAPYAITKRIAQATTHTYMYICVCAAGVMQAKCGWKLHSCCSYCCSCFCCDQFFVKSVHLS